MSTITLPFTDSVTMLRRSLVHAVRYPLVAYLIATPVIFLLLFVYVLGDTLGAGIGGATAGAAGGDAGTYLRYVVPGVLLLTVAGGVSGPAITVAKDLSEGIVARFRTMNISRSAVLTGHVLGNLAQVLVAVVVVIGVAFLMGLRTPAGVLGWLGAVVLLAGIGYALCWLGAAIGVFAKGVESASNLPMPILVLPFLGSGFVPTASMPAWLRWFAEAQPFTPFIETLRALLFGTDLGLNGWLSAAWIVAISLGGWLWARFLYERRTLR